MVYIYYIMLVLYVIPELITITIMIYEYYRKQYSHIDDGICFIM